MTDITCAACLAPVVPTLCGTTGAVLHVMRRVCPACGAQIDGDDFLCAACRQSVDRKRTSIRKDVTGHA